MSSKWIPRLFYKKADGGKESGVTGYMLIEWKPVFSIGLLHFRKGSREASHSHAFNGITWWLRGHVSEIIHPSKMVQDFWPSLKPKITKRGCFHKVYAHKDTWALTFRGPWEDTWQEYRPQSGYVTLTHGRREVEKTTP